MNRNAKIVSILLTFTFIFSTVNVSAEFVKNDDCGCKLKTEDTDIIGEYGMGWLQGEPADGLTIPVSPELTGLIPDSWDWRDTMYKGTGGNWLTPVKDQGACGSCWVFAVTAAMEVVYAIEQDNPTFDKDLSEQYAISCATFGIMDEGYLVDGCCGGHLQHALKFLKEQGTVTERCFPYQAIDQYGRNASECGFSGSHTPVTCDEKCDEWEGKIYKIKRYYTLLNADSVKRAIIQHGPVVTGFTVYKDFKDYESGVYRRQSDVVSGGHMVIIIGFNDAEQYWICKNSWGTDWGDEGYFKIGYGECGIAEPGTSAYISGVRKVTAKPSFNPCDLLLKFSFFKVIQNMPIFRDLFEKELF